MYVGMVQCSPKIMCACMEILTGGKTAEGTVHLLGFHPVKC